MQYTEESEEDDDDDDNCYPAGGVAVDVVMVAKTQRS